MAANGNKYVSLRESIEWECQNPRLLPGGAVNMVQAPAANVVQAPAVNMAQAPAAPTAPVADARAAPQQNHTATHQQPSRAPWPGAVTCYVCNGCDYDVTACPASARTHFVQRSEPDHGAYSIDDEVDEVDFRIDVQGPSLCMRALGAMRTFLIFLALALGSVS